VSKADEEDAVKKVPKKFCPTRGFLFVSSSLAALPNKGIPNAGR
jgi:hypothetical protein